MSPINTEALPDHPAIVSPITKEVAKDLISCDRRYKTLDIALKRNHYQPDALIEVLHKAQESFGYLEEEILLYIARQLKLPLSRVYGVASFYHLFSLNPSGVHNCVVCLGTACYVKGANQILNRLEAELGIKVGETTSDGQISLLSARCLGACGLAPAAVFDGEVGGKLTPEESLVKLQVLTANSSQFAAI
ncbi:bidirectional hydrogenase complex protein HoxE [Merismopedia glauca]|uniref:NAD(P)H-dependent oxidoreductase subunit E n=1 Tax=Merismopedia glauca CCAP 1448/3 TaxID=1296344 RepID=A0A2T1C3A7_9CYAN|nr:bidirectional hydrogenase complex protein HoxE [Merismopedia glauca]PSB02749.1 NAD(P)H-dependent oxidoreductase subunit E [Merismopedia glauca CCAP 1448/3]